MDAAERALLAEAVDAALTAVGSGGDADTALADLGWLDMLEAEPDDAIALVFTALGTANATDAALDDVVASALGAAPGPGRAVLLPAWDAATAPGRIDGSTLRAAGLATARVATAPDVLIACDGGVAVVPVAAASVEHVRGVDPAAGLHRVHVEHAGASVSPIDASAWTAAVALGRRAVAHQIAGASRAMLALARTHALERVQFGRPVASFQAVRHRLAEAFVAVEALDATLAAAADDGGAVTAALAKATAGRTARTVGTHCQQVLAGIGFTTDHPFHRYLRRTMLLDGLFGTAESITVELGRACIAERRVPTLVEL